MFSESALKRIHNLPDSMKLPIDDLSERELKNALHEAFESLNDIEFDALGEHSEAGRVKVFNRAIDMITNQSWVYEQYTVHDYNPFIFSDYLNHPKFSYFDDVIDELNKRYLEKNKKFSMTVAMYTRDAKPMLSSYQYWLDNIATLENPEQFINSAYSYDYFELQEKFSDPRPPEYHFTFADWEKKKKEYDKKCNNYRLQRIEIAKSTYRDLGFPYQKTKEEYMRFNDLLNPLFRVLISQYDGQKSIFIYWKNLVKMLFCVNDYTFFHKKHCYIVGRSGSGKSELLKSIYKYLAPYKKIVIDPHGEFARDIRNLIPSTRYVNFYKQRFVINPFDVADKSPENRELVAQEITNLLGELMEDSNLSRLMETIIFPVVYTMLKLPYADLAMLRDMLHPSEGREKLEALAERAESHHKMIFAGLTADTYDTSKTSIFNRLQSILNYRTILYTVCGHDEFEANVNAMVNSDRENSLVFSLPIPDLGEAVSQILGRILMTRLQVWARRRNTIPEKERKQVFLFVDEFQNFLSNATAQTLDQFGRKFGLNMLLAHQHIGQITNTEIKGSVLANTKIKIIGRTNQTTTKAIAPEMGISADMLDTIETGFFYIQGEKGKAFKFYNVPAGYGKHETLKLLIRNRENEIPDAWRWIHTRKTEQEAPKSNAWGQQGRNTPNTQQNAPEGQKRAFSFNRKSNGTPPQGSATRETPKFDRTPPPQGTKQSATEEAQQQPKVKPKFEL